MRIVVLGSLLDEVSLTVGSSVDGVPVSNHFGPDEALANGRLSCIDGHSLGKFAVFGESVHPGCQLLDHVLLAGWVN